MVIYDCVHPLGGGTNLLHDTPPPPPAQVSMGRAAHGTGGLSGHLYESSCIYEFSSPDLIGS